MRIIKACDIFPMIKIITALGIKNDLAEIFKEQSENSRKVISIAFLFIENLHKAEIEIYEFVAGLMELTAPDVKELPLERFVDALMQIFSDKNFGSFFKLAAK